MGASVSYSKNQKLTRYNTCYSDLSNLILGMTFEEQSLLLEQAKKINYSNKEKGFRRIVYSKYGTFLIGFLAGWLFTSVLFVIFAQT